MQDSNIIGKAQTAKEQHDLASANEEETLKDYLKAIHGGESSDTGNTDKTELPEGNWYVNSNEGMAFCIDDSNHWIAILYFEVNEKTAQLGMINDISFTTYSGAEMELKGLTITEGDRILEINGDINHVIKGNVLYMGVTSNSNLNVEFRLDSSFSLSAYGIENLEVNEN